MEVETKSPRPSPMWFSKMTRVL